METQVWHFARVQKTAGDSFRTYLHELFPADAICPHMFEYQLNEDPSDRKYKLYTGHISIGALSERVPNSRLILLLRDPQERLISAYHFWKDMGQRPENRDNPFFSRLRELTFIEYLTSDDPLLRASSHNVQARMLAGGRFGASSEGRTGIYGPSMSEEDIVAQAKRTLESAFFVGLQHRLDESASRLMAKMGRRLSARHNALTRLMDKMGVPLPPKYYALNKGEARKSASPPNQEERDVLKAITVLDQAVFDYACELFENDR